MKTFSVTAIVFAAVLASIGAATAQEWTTAGADAQRSSWMRTDPKISKESMQKPGFQFLWKMKFSSEPAQVNSLTPPVLLERLIGYRGFRSLAFVGGSSNTVFTVDSDLARAEWQKRLVTGASAPSGSPGCPGGMTAGVVRASNAAIPAPVAGRGRGNPAASGVGEAGQGAVTLAQGMARRPPPVLQAPARGAAPPPNPNGPNSVFALSSDGMLHRINTANGADARPAVKFLPPGANVQGLVVINNVAYAATTNGCGGVPDGVWSLEIESGEVKSWKSGAAIAGSAGYSIGPDGTIYTATVAGEITALDRATLERKDWYSTGKQEITSSPVIFDFQGKVLLAATTKDGRLHLLNTASLGGPDHLVPLSRKAITPNVAPGALSTWQDAGGARWILAPSANSIVAWKVVEENGTPSVEAGWTSREMVSPLPPSIVNGVVFAVSSGAFRTTDTRMTPAQRAQRSSPAVLYALDAVTGKELWNSGATITSFVNGGGASAGGGHVYVGAYDGTLYAFGFPMEH